MKTDCALCLQAVRFASSLYVIAGNHGPVLSVWRAANTAPNNSMMTSVIAMAALPDGAAVRDLQWAHKKSIAAVLSSNGQLTWCVE